MPNTFNVRLADGANWSVRELPLGTGVRRGIAAPIDPFAGRLEATGRVEVVHAAELKAAARRGPEPAGATVVVEAQTAPGEFHVLMVRHASGAITFELPTESAAVRRRAATKTVRFTVLLPDESVPGAEGLRRGIVSRVVRTFVLKVAGKLADLAMPALGRAWETLAWKAAGRAEGWKTVTAAALAQKSLPVITDPNAFSSDASKPNLLLIHGTFSNAVGAFSGLAAARGSDNRTFFEALAPVYGDRMFAFDHFTVSRTPEENVKMMLDALPNRNCVFDVVTHSRGGLVLRHLTELGSSFGSLSSRFVLRNSVLVASPNAGTPLATPSRFELFVSWISNFCDLFPENPFTEAVSFIADAIGWLAHRVVGALPGLAAMDNNGTEIRLLQVRGASDPAYSALVSNFEPDANLLKRMADVGVDVFFGSANDLVVPSEGAWRVDPGAAPIIPGTRIGCFGRGGNIAQPSDGPVTHGSYFTRPATVDFLVRALRGDPQPLAAIDPDRDLPYLLRRRITAAAQAPAPALTAVTAQPSPVPAPVVAAVFTGRPVTAFTDEVFNISILDVDGSSAPKSRKEPAWAILLATFRNARAIAKLEMRGGEAGQRFRRIIATHVAIQNYVNGKPGASEVPHGDRLVALGCDLFETLFPGDVRRLYDVARAEQANRRINLIFTSGVHWLADLPWEFVYDPARRTFLASSEVNFTRNVTTEIPGDRFIGRSAALRILVVVAQPLGLAHLSVEDERNVIVSGFRKLIDAGLASVDVLLDATPGLLHQTLEVHEYDVLHFIGHGEYNPDTDLGYVLFEDEMGGAQQVDSQTLQQIVCRRNIRLVFLNACETGEGGHADFNRGVAPALVQAGVPSVIGNQYSVLDVSATAFARHLYWALAHGRTIGDAAREARVAVNYLISGEAIDWAVPVLFTRDPADRLCSAREVVDLERDVVIDERRSFRRTARGRSRIALWDVQKIIPDLDKIADQMTNAQQKFAFEAVWLPAPLGTWRREPDAGVAYLNAEQVADRLKSKPDELGVNRLIAFTNLPMRDSDTVDLFGWDGEPDYDISLFSMYDLLDQLNPPVLTVQKMVVNAAVAFLAGVPVHRGGPKNCPMFYNDEREIEWIAGPLQFCTPCRRKLDPDVRAALESLVALYP